MAGNQPARRDMDAGGIDDWMVWRNAQVDRRAESEATGKAQWSASTRTGQYLQAARPSDVVALGTVTPSPRALQGARPLSPEIEELRRQQAAFKKVTRELDRENRWMAGIALAPVAAVGGLEAVPYSIARAIAESSSGEPLVFSSREPPARIRGDNYYARYGRRMDREFGEKVKAKPNWRYQPRETAPDGSLKIPDAGLPIRSEQKRFLDLKPNTPSGRKAGRSAVAKYKDLGRTRIVYYDRTPEK